MLEHSKALSFSQIVFDKVVGLIFMENYTRYVKLHKIHK